MLVVVKVLMLVCILIVLKAVVRSMLLVLVILKAVMLLLMVVLETLHLLLLLLLYLLTECRNVASFQPQGRRRAGFRRFALLEFELSR